MDNVLTLFRGLIWNETIFVFKNWEWGWLALTLILGIGLSQLVGRLIQSAIRRYLVKAVKARYVESWLQSNPFRFPVALATLGWFWLAGVSVVSVSPHTMDGLSVAAKALTYVGVIILIWRSAAVLQAFFMSRDRASKSKIDQLLGPLISKVVHLVAILFGVLSFAELFHFPIASLLTGLGLGGFAIAMAAKETVANIFGSMTILIDRPFQIGDAVKLGDVEGEVESVGFRSTRIRTPNDSVTTIPNAALLTLNVDNLGARKYRRFRQIFSVELSTPEKLDAYCQAIHSMLANNPLVIKDKIQVFLSEVTAHGVTITVAGYFDVHNQDAENSAKHHLILSLLQLANDHQISLFVQKS